MRYMLFVWMALVLTGCTSTRVVDTQAPSPYAEVNEATQGRMVEVRLVDGRALHVTDLDIAPDVASYVDANGQMQAVATDAIRQVTFVRRGRGALVGIGIGLLGGGGGGALVGLASGMSCGADDWFCGPGFNAAVFGTVFGAIGGVVGLATGTARGHRTVYRLHADRQPLAERDPRATAEQEP